jgi:hypothetical protein
MIHVDVYPVGGDEYTLDVNIYFRDDSGDGIRHVAVWDTHSVTITAEAPDDPVCPGEFMIGLTAIERGRFPLIIQAIDCAGAESELIPWPGDRDPDESCVLFHVRGVDNPACRTAGDEVRRIRSEILELCSAISWLTSQRDTYAIAAAAFLAAAGALFISAAAVAGIPIFGQLLAGLLAGMAVVCLAFAVFYGVMAANAQARLNEAQGWMRDARERFTAAADRARSACCPDDPMPDLDQPECP